MTAAELAEAGRLLFGERWQSSLAKLLGVNSRTVRYWASGKRPIPEEQAVRIFSAIEARGAGIAAWRTGHSWLMARRAEAEDSRRFADLRQPGEAT